MKDLLRQSRNIFFVVTLAALMFTSYVGAATLETSLNVAPSLLTPTPTLTATPTPTPSTTLKLRPEAQPEETNLPISQSLNPTFEQIVNLGLPVGNATAPQHLAFDRATGRLYIFSAGLPILNQGNSLSVYNSRTGQFTAHLTINDGPHTPLDLQFDPKTGYVCALWEGQYGSEIPATVTVIDSQSLQVIQEIPEAQAMAVAGGLLYVAGPDQLTIFDLSESSLLLERDQADLLLATGKPRLAVDAANNRLYLAQADNSGWRLDILTADTLTLLNSYATPGEILDILPSPPNGQLLIAEDEGSDRFLHRLSIDGELLAPRYRIGQAYDGYGLALSGDGTQLYFSSKIPYLSPDQEQETSPGLIGLTLAEFLPDRAIPLLTSFDELVIDDVTQRAFALYPFDNLLYIIDLAEETAQIVNTAVEIRDVLVDEESGDLFVSDSANRIRRLDGDKFDPLAEIQLEGSGQSYGFKGGLGAGELALDKKRNRLYVSGLPAYVLEADTLELKRRLDPGGQFAFAPDDNQIYLSNCGVAILEAQSLISQTVIAGSARRPDILGSNPCIDYSQLDPLNQLLYSLADNNVPGSNSGTLLYVYDVAAEPRLIFTDTNISIIQALPDPANRRAFISYAREINRQLRILSVTSPASSEYTHQLGSLAGQTRYSPPTHRLYVSDGGRLLALEAGSLDVIGEMPLPPDYDYRLAALDPATEKLYLAGLDGQLLIADGSRNASRSENLAALAASGVPLPDPAQRPHGSILAVEALPNGDVLVLSKASDDFGQDYRLFLTADNGRSWHDLSQELPQLPVQAVAVSPNYAVDQTLFVALSVTGASGGLYQSIDGGQSWTAAMRGLRDLTPNRLFLAPDFGQVQAPTGELMLVNTLYAGLHISLDGGQSWRPQTSPAVDSLFASTANSAAAISAGGSLLISQILGESEGVFRATVEADGDLSRWQKVLDAPLTLLALAPNERTVFGFGSGLWRSTDGGLTWQPGGAGLTDLDITQANRFLFSPDFDTDQTVYLFFKDIRGDASGRLFRSTDAGQSWQLWDNPPRSKRFTSITQTPAGDFLFGDDATQLTSLAPSSLTWAAPEAPAGPFPLDDLAISPDYAQDQTLWAISRAHGLFKSDNGGRAWRQTTFPVRSASFDGYRLALSPDYGQDQTLYLATGFSLHRSTDGGQSWQSLQLRPQQSGFAAQQLALSPDFAEDDTLLASAPDVIYRSTDRGDTWQRALPRPEMAGEARVLIFSPASGAAYAWFDYDSDLFISRNGGQRWQTQPGQPEEESFAVVTGAIGPDDILMLRPDFYPPLFQISDEGQTRRALTGVLPDSLSNVQAMAYTPDGALLVGGLGGVWQSFDNGQSWQSLNGDLPLDAAVKRLRLAGDSLFVLLTDGQIFTSDDGGVSWRNIAVVK